jgi:uncharacterized DUF497 family protein
MFEWDEPKRRANLEKHGIDFADVLPLFGRGDALIYEDRRKDYGEPRYVLLARLGPTVLYVAYTLRGDVVRIISARRASRQERREHERETANQGPSHRR